MTVRNEAANLPLLLDSVLAQTLRPAEIVIVDGGSTDGTPQVARSYMGRLPVRLVELPGANISEGRNAAIRAAACDLVAVTDAGVRLDAHWLERLARPQRGQEQSVLGAGQKRFELDPGAFNRLIGARPELNVRTCHHVKIASPLGKRHAPVDSDREQDHAVQ